MLKLSKISKVILFSGILLAFSGVGNVVIAAGSNGNSTYEGLYGEEAPASTNSSSSAPAQLSCEEKCEVTHKDNRSQRNACKAKCKSDAARKAAEDTQKALDNATGSVKTTTTTTTKTTKDGKTSTSTSASQVVKADGAGSSAWADAKLAKDNAQKDYTKASTEYNKCVASKGASACAEEKTTMESAKSTLDEKTGAYNTAQKEASDAYYKNKVAQEKAEKAAAKAEKKQLKADNKALKKAEKELNKCKKEKGKDCSALEQKVKDAQKAVDSHTKAANTASNASSETAEFTSVLNDPNASAYDKEVARNALENYKREKEAAAKKAEAECERYSAMTSNDARAKAVEACALAESLSKEAAEAGQALSGLAGSMPEGSARAAEKRVREVSGDDRNNSELGIVDITRKKNEIDVAGYRSELFNYESGGDVLEVVTRRAALAVVSLKPIVYIFAGFGLIAFAWMAIFNKISWKWFANIAMGLFLVANMGRLIEYFVGDGTKDGGYYIGVWNDGAKKGPANSRLANATKDIYHIYGEVGYNDKGIREWSDQTATSTSESSDIFSASARGFCQGTSGSGWANFTSCLGDIVSTAKKAANTVKTAVAVVEDVKDRIDTVKDTVSNVVQAAKNMKGASFTEIISNAGTILNNVNQAISTTTGVVGSLQNAASSISNNIQDMGKSTEQQQELADRRARGEATNKFDAQLKGQEWNAATGGVENVDGEYASKSTGLSNLVNAADNISQKSAELNSKVQEGLTQAGAVTNAVENFSIFGSKSINEARQDKQAKKDAAKHQAKLAAEQEAYLNSNAGKNSTYNQKDRAANNLQSNLQQQKNEVKTLENEVKNAQAAVNNACRNGESDLCTAAKNSLKSTEDALKSKQDQVAATEIAYEVAVEERNAAKNTALESNIAETKKDYEAAQTAAEEACAIDAGGKACADARKKASDEAKKLTNYLNERDGSPTEDIYKQPATVEQTAADKNSDYRSSVNETNRLYGDLQQQEADIKNLESDVKSAQKAIDENCKGDDDTSALCRAARSDLKTSQDALSATKALAEQTKTDYATAKNNMDAAYKEALDSNIAQAEKALEQAQTAAEEACAANAASRDCAQARKEAKRASETLTSYVDEKANQTNKNKEQTTEDIDDIIASHPEQQQMKKAEQTLAYDQEQAVKQQQNEAAYAAQDYSKAVDEANTLYIQMKAQEDEAQKLQQAAQEAAQKANAACAKDSSGAVCSTASLAAKTAKEAAENKKQQAKETQNKYAQAQTAAETAYNKSVQAGASQAQRDYNSAQEQIETAQAQIKEANAKMADASAAASTAENKYTKAKDEASAAQAAYNAAVAQGKSKKEIDRLNEEYQAKLRSMVQAENDYKEKASAYNKLQEQKKNAEQSYYEAYEKSNSAGNRLSSYTNEQVNKTGDTRLTSQEDIDAQILIAQYKSGTNPNAVAQASRSSYIESQNKAAVAKETLTSKQNQTRAAKQAYEEALKAAAASGSAEDRRKADRLKQSYDLALSEQQAAASEYAILTEELKVSEAEYKQKVAASEAYNQTIYTKQMQTASADINKYELAMVNQRKVVEEAATVYTQALSQLAKGDAAGERRVAELYKKYNDAKQLYSQYQAALKQARSDYSSAQTKYQSSVVAYEQYNGKN